jgi:hypothetical protein
MRINYSTDKHFIRKWTYLGETSELELVFSFDGSFDNVEKILVNDPLDPSLTENMLE